MLYLHLSYDLFPKYAFICLSLQSPSIKKALQSAATRELMEFLFDYLAFLAKAATLVLALIAVIAVIAQSIQQAKEIATDERIEVKKLNDRFENMQQAIEQQLQTPEEQQLQAKAEKKRLKAEHKANKKLAKEKAKEQTDNAVAEAPSEDESDKKRVFVIDFDGDIRANAVDNMREEISAILTVAKPTDEVLIRLESPGGVVHGYGLAASQLQRIKDASIPLTACVDKVAASGGYMMACVADKVVAAPFSIIGSIGVVAQLPNFHRLLKKNDIDFEQHTAGDYKRTVTMFGENTDADRAKFKQELEDTHGLFKDFVANNRPELDIDKVATGEHWHGIQALELGLVDELRTSDDYLLAAHKEHAIFHVKHVAKKTLGQKFGMAAQSTVDKLLTKLPANS
jgi:serine protease SohB